MEMNIAQASFHEGGEIDRPVVETINTDGDETRGPILGASLGVALQEIFLWPLALAVAFAWLLQV